MKKIEAIAQLGGSIAEAARAVGVSYHAVRQWPDVLPQRIADRVQAALWRRLNSQALQATAAESNAQEA